MCWLVLISLNLISTWNLKLMTKQQMPIYLGWNVGGIQANFFDIKANDEDYEIQKPHMKIVKNEE